MKKKNRNALTGYILILPALFLLSVFFLYPLVHIFWSSFHKVRLFGKPKWVGLDNFIYIFNDTDFWESLDFTFYYTVTVTPLLFRLAFLSALICNSKLKGTTFFRSMYFMPVVVSFAASCSVWLWLYSEMYGVITLFLNYITASKDPINLFLTVDSSLWAVNFMTMWKFSGISMIIIIAGMQSIRDDYYEASTLMGSGKFSNVWHIPIPLLKPTFALVFILSIAGSIQAFEHFLIMTGGAPSNETRTVMMYIIENAFRYFKLGKASAMSIVVMIMLIALTLIQLRIFRKQY